MALALRHELALLDARTQRILAQWAVPTGTERYQGAPGGLAFSPDGRRLVSTDVAGGIWVWPVPTEQAGGLERQGVLPLADHTHSSMSARQEAPGASTSRPASRPRACRLTASVVQVYGSTAKAWRCGGV